MSRLSAMLSSKRGIVVLVAAIFVPIVVQAAPAGRIDFAIGEVVAARDGQERTLSKGALVNVGDTILTRRGRAQVRFTDGGYVSLQPQTEFRVDEYSLPERPDGSERGFFSLVKGGMRTVTGLIGRSNRDAYRVQTPVATIGIRGTYFTANMNEVLKFHVGDGAACVGNDGGVTCMGAGQGCSTGSSSQQCTEDPDRPYLPPPQPDPEEITYSVSEDTDSEGQALVVVNEIAAEGLALHWVDGETFCSSGGCKFDLDASVTRNASGVMTSYTLGSSFSSFSSGSVTVTSGSTSVDGGFDGIVGWSRWTNGTTTLNGASYLSYSGRQGEHHVHGIATAQLPTSGTWTYNLMASTQPTFGTPAGGVAGPATISGTLTGNFGPVPTADTSLTIAYPSDSVFLSATGLNVDSTGIYGAGMATTSGPTWECYPSCSVFFEGNFFGTNAQRAAYVYQANLYRISSGSETMQGAAVFQR